MTFLLDRILEYFNSFIDWITEEDRLIEKLHEPKKAIVFRGQVWYSPYMDAVFIRTPGGNLFVTEEPDGQVFLTGLHPSSIYLGEL